MYLKSIKYGNTIENIFLCLCERYMHLHIHAVLECARLLYYSRVVKFNLITAKFGCLCQPGKKQQKIKKCYGNKKNLSL